MDFNAGEIVTFIESFNREYEAKHKAYEDNFWATKMNLKDCSRGINFY